MGKMQLALLEDGKSLSCERIEGVDRPSNGDFLIRIVLAQTIIEQ